jgi:hypothetical protein
MSGERMVVSDVQVKAAHAAILAEVIEHLDWNLRAYGQAWTGEDEDAEFIVGKAARKALVAAFDAAPASDRRFAQIRDLLAVWAGEGSKIGEAHAIASAAAAGERVSLIDIIEARAAAYGYVTAHDADAGEVWYLRGGDPEDAYEFGDMLDDVLTRELTQAAAERGDDG